MLPDYSAGGSGGGAPRPGAASRGRTEIYRVWSLLAGRGGDALSEGLLTSFCSYLLVGIKKTNNSICSYQLNI